MSSLRIKRESLKFLFLQFLFIEELEPDIHLKNAIYQNARNVYSMINYKRSGEYLKKDKK